MEQTVFTNIKFEDNREHKKSFPSDQLEKYAIDFVRLYNIEKEDKKQLKELNKQLQNKVLNLESVINELNITKKALTCANIELIQKLVLAAEFRDDDTGKHIQRVSKYSYLLSKLKNIPHKTARNIALASTMHDIGKIGIPDYILLKKGELSPSEKKIMQQHSLIGAKILANSDVELLQIAYKIALTHHEKWNGSGYPNGIKETNIPLCGRIVAIVDVFDALSTNRCYKKVLSLDNVYSIIKTGKGQHFDPELTELFLNSFDLFMKLKNDVNQDFKMEEFYTGSNNS